MCTPIDWLSEQDDDFRSLRPEEQNAILHFSIIWSYFEAKVCNRNANSDLLAGKAREWDGRGILEPEVLAPFLKHFQRRYVDPKGNLNAKFESLNVRGCCRTLVEDVLTDQRTAPGEVATCLLLIVYRLRNRLFHGEKWSAGGLQDQMDNFTMAVDFLKLAVDLNRRERHGRPGE